LPRRVRKRIRIFPLRIRALAGARNSKKTPTRLILNNPRSSMKPESEPDPVLLTGKVLKETERKHIIDKLIDNTYKK